MCVQLSSTLLSDEESISLLDYIVRQVYVEELPDDPYATSPSAPSLLSGLSALQQAASTAFPPLTSPPHPLHLPTYNLLASTLDHLSSCTAASPASSPAAASSASPAVSAIASQRVFRVLRQFVADWRYSEQKLGLKEAAAGGAGGEQDGEEEAVGMGDWLAEQDEGEEEGEVQTMSMADFLGSDAEQDEDEEDEDEDEGADEAGSEHRIDVRRDAEAERKDTVSARSTKVDIALGGGGDDEEDELDEVQLDELELDEADEDGALDLQFSPPPGRSNAKGLR